MALAKFTEEITERYLEGTDALRELHAVRDPRSEWVQRPTEATDAAAIRSTQGRWWDDHVAFATGEPVAFEVVTYRRDARPKLTWHSLVHGTAPKLAQPGRATTIESPSALSGDLVVTCGNYSKTYRVSFVARAQPEHIPDFASELAALTENPPQWSQASFDRFAQRTETILAAHNVPADFRDGVREYYLGLYHEQLRDARFGARLDRAYALLNPFVPFSHLAALICGYHLYRINAFDHPWVQRALRRIGRVVRFFTSADAATPAPTSHDATQALELIIAPVDNAIIAAVDHLDAGNADAALEEALRASEACTANDQQAYERICFLRARAHAASGSCAEALRHAALLGSSPVPHFNTLARTLAAQPTARCP